MRIREPDNIHFIGILQIPPRSLKDSLIVLDCGGQGRARPVGSRRHGANASAGSEEKQRRDPSCSSSSPSSGSLPPLSLGPLRGSGMGNSLFDLSVSPPPPTFFPGIF